MIFITPKPNQWNKIHQRLKSHWEKEIKVGVPPPVPLILAGWNFSNDSDKMERWEMTLKWAEDNNCIHLIPVLTDDEKYYVHEISSFRPYEFHSMDEKYKPSREEIIEALEKLKENWISVLDDDFPKNTKPVSFSGNKSRCLKVYYKSNYLPPWGTWTDHLVYGRPSKFTMLRSNVNKIISPLEVDHIVFEEDNTDNK
ncbi:MAG: hypothetical protein IPG78_11575 [Ignavibacteria bacterium]|nr:hypothetical protein [Ignavibacteria bacterium]